jgi:hypothetical protein
MHRRSPCACLCVIAAFDHDSTAAPLVKAISQVGEILELSEKLQGKPTMLKASRSAIMSTVTEKHLSNSTKSGSTFHLAKTVNMICKKESKSLSIDIKNRATLIDALHKLKECNFLPYCSFTDVTFNDLKTGDKLKKYDLFLVMVPFLTPLCLLLPATLGQKTVPNYSVLMESVQNSICQC